MDPKPPRTPQGPFFWIFIAGLLLIALWSYQAAHNGPPPKLITTTELYGEIDKGNVQELLLARQGGEVSGKFKPVPNQPPVSFASNVADVGELEKHAIAKGVSLKVQDASGDGWSLFWGIPFSLLPWIFIIGFFWLIFRQMRSNPVGNFDTTFKLETNIKTRFADVAGCNEVVEEARDIVDFLANSEIYQVAGIEAPKGLLLEGAPGVGKTLLARAIAGEAGLTFISVSGSGFEEKLVGVGADRMRRLFSEARKRLPCIIFIDEIDAIGKRRGSTLNTYNEQCLTELLNQMDGFKETENLLVIGATNTPDVLDPALLRRFSRKIEMPYPDTKGREAILKVHTSGKKLADDVNFTELAKMTSGFSGDDLKKLAQEAARVAVERLLTALKSNDEAIKRFSSVLRDKLSVTRADFLEAFETNTLGRARKSRVVSQADREVTAYHEAGHALAIIHAPDTEPLGKVTIVPRGRAGGFTTQVPEDHMFLTKEQLLARIVVSMGGRAAEMKKFQKQSTGASMDFQHATALALAVVAKYGMNAKVGKMVYLDEHQYLKGVAQLNCSPEMRLIIEEEARKLVDEAYSETEQLIDAHADDLEKLAQALLEKETLDAKEVYALLGKTPV